MHDHLGNQTLNGLLDQRAAEHSDRRFLTFEDRDGRVQELTYGELHELVTRCAGGLAGLGLGPGDMVVVHMANAPELLVTWFAVTRLGAVLVPSNTANTADELRYLLEVTGARRVVTEERWLQTVERAVGGVAGDHEIVVARGSAGVHRAFDDLLDPAACPPGHPGRADVSGDDLAELIFTSGTTSKPKGVMLTHANLVNAGFHAIHCLWLADDERCLTALPLFHVNAQAMSVLPALVLGSSVVLIEEFRASKFWAQVRRHRATQTCLVAMQLRTLIAQPPDDADRRHHVRRLFFAINVTDEEKDAFEQRFGVSLINGYGCTEAMTLLACAPVAGPRRWPSVGRPAVGRRIVLLDEAGEEVGPGEVGEVVVEGMPGRDLMLGYYRDSAETASAFRGGRFHTGDNARVDEEGFLYFVDRKKNMIKRSGENIAAAEVEAVLSTHPMVVEACVLGVPDPLRDEAVAAVVVPAAGSSVSADELVAHCARRLAKFKVPTVVRFRDELPKTSIGKIRRDVLARELREPTAEPTGSVDHG